jgi:hypothetical protein
MAKAIDLAKEWVSENPDVIKGSRPAKSLEREAPCLEVKFAVARSNRGIPGVPRVQKTKPLRFSNGWQRGEPSSFCKKS